MKQKSEPADAVVRDFRRAIEGANYPLGPSASTFVAKYPSTSAQRRA